MAGLPRQWRFSCCLCRARTGVDRMRRASEGEECPVCLQQQEYYISFQNCSHAVCIACMAGIYKANVPAHERFRPPPDPEENDYRGVPRHILEIRNVMRQRPRIRPPPVLFQERGMFNSLVQNIREIVGLSPPAVRARQQEFMFGGADVFWMRDPELEAWVLSRDVGPVYGETILPDDRPMRETPQVAIGADHVAWVARRWISW